MNTSVSENQPHRIIGAGICCLDHIIVAPSVSWGDTAPVREYCTQGGGLAATALVACARLGARAELVSMLGEDAIAAQIVDGLKDEGVSTDHVACHPEGASPFSVIHVDESTGERTIFHRHAVGLGWGGMDWDFLAGAQVMLIDDYYPDLTREAVRAARLQGIPTVADTIPDPANMDWYRDVQVLIAPRHFLQVGGFNDVDQALDAIHALGPATAVITLGADGWAASGPDGHSHGASFPVDVVDTVGAGDVFHGAYAFGLARGWTTPRSAEFASAVAAIKCTCVGGRTSIPTLERTLDFLQVHNPNDWTGIN